MADFNISKGPVQDSDFFGKNGTLRQMSEVSSAISGMSSSSAMDRIFSIVKLIGSIIGM